MHDPFENQIIYEDMLSIEKRTDLKQLRNATVFVTGASGMLASYLVLFLIWLNERHSYDIKIYAGVRHPSKAEARFGVYSQRNYFHLYTDDVNLPVTLNVKVDYIIHAASLASPQFYGSNPVETILPNVIGTNELLKFSERCKVKAFLFFSSGAVYGEMTDVDKIRENDIGYLDYCALGSAYGESKRCGEALSLAYFREYGIPVKIVRINHTYGPTLDLNNDRRAFSEFVKNVIHHENIILKSDGHEKRAFCYLSDATVAFFKILLCGKAGEAYNLVNEKEFISIKELAELLIALSPQKDLSIVYQPREEKGYLNLAQTSAICCSSEKLRALGFEPLISAAEGFKRTIKFFEEIDICDGDLGV